MNRPLGQGQCGRHFYTMPRSETPGRCTESNFTVGRGSRTGRDQGAAMPEKRTLERARRDKREGKAPSTQAGEFVREEIEHVRQGKHGARSTKQAIAIGLSKARRSGVDLKSPR